MVLVSGVPDDVSTLALDANGLVYQAVTKVTASGQDALPEDKLYASQLSPEEIETEILNAFTTSLTNLLAQTHPVDNFVIAIDGTPPTSKIQQQSQRRYRNAKERTSTFLFDTNSITPGTAFMFRLDNTINRWLSFNRLNLPAKTIYSNHLMPGEGEHKILDMFRRGEITGSGAHIIYGLDADLAMLSLLSPLDKMTLMREDVWNVVNIDNLKFALEQELQSPTAIKDFILMMYLIGNDFLPHAPALHDMGVSLELMFEVYKKVNLPLTIEASTQTEVTSREDVDEDGNPVLVETTNTIESPPVINWINLAVFLEELRVMRILFYLAWLSLILNIHRE